MNSYASPEATTALYIDEQPLTAASLTPDLHIYDIERVEFLWDPKVLCMAQVQHLEILKS